MKNLFLLSLLAGLLIGCGDKSKIYQFQVADLEPNLITLSSDEFMGRMPFTEGEQLTTSFLESKFKEMGLEPGNGDSYFQEVPMVSIITYPEQSLEFKGPQGSVVGEGLKDFVIWTQRPDSLVRIQDAFFKGNTMTYYGRWTYKYEEAVRQGALGCLIVHNTIPAGYGFNNIQNSWKASKLYLDDRGQDKYKLGFEGWITLPFAKQLFEKMGKNESELLQNARKPYFQGFSTGMSLSTSLTVKPTYNVSKNVVAKITGKTAPEEVIIYTAHWDHIGIGKPDETGDTIYNGALDNASGTAALLALAKAFKTDEQPDRTVVFLAVTAEEQGLWGSAYYAKQPIYPKEKTVANINMDGVNPYGKMKDVSVIGVGQSEMEDLLDEELKKLGRYAAPEPNPLVGYYFRSDHFNFAKIGIPALYIGTGIDHVEKGKEYGKQLQDDYVAQYYHKPADAYDPKRWNLDGAVDDVQLLYQVGRNLANSTRWPGWKEGSEFKAIRDSYFKN